MYHAISRALPRARENLAVSPTSIDLEARAPSPDLGTAARTCDLDTAARFFLQLVDALHVFGMGVHRMEMALNRVAESLGLPGQFLVTPTFVVFTIGEVEDARTHVARVGHQELDLVRLTRLHRLVRQIVNGAVTLEEASERLELLRAPRAPWSTAATVTGLACSSAGAAVVLQGGWPEVMAATVLGAAIGSVISLAERRTSLQSIVPLLAGAIASFGAAGMAAGIHPMVPYIPTLAAIITLLPGMTLTIAINELAHEHSVSGGARLTGAMMTLLQLGFGVALGKELALKAVGAPVMVDPASLDTVWVTLAAAVLVLAFAVRSHARPRDLPVLLLTAGLGLAASKVGTAALGPELGVAVSAWIIGIAGNLTSRWANIPVLTTVLPAILLMVPGSLGFSSMSSLIAQDVVVGLQGVLSMVLIAFSLVTGLLLANLTSRPTDLF